MMKASAAPPKTRRCPGLRGPHHERNGGIPPTTISSPSQGAPELACACSRRMPARTRSSEVSTARPASTTGRIRTLRECSIALDVDVRVGVEVLGASGDAVGACGVLAGHHAANAELPARLLDAMVVGRDDGVIEPCGLLASLVDMPQQRLVSGHGQGLSWES